jgi:hypothetical protein
MIQIHACARASSRPAAASTKAVRPPAEASRREYAAQIASGAAKAATPATTASAGALPALPGT